MTNPFIVFNIFSCVSTLRTNRFLPFCGRRIGNSTGTIQDKEMYCADASVNLRLSTVTRLNHCILQQYVPGLQSGGRRCRVFHTTVSIPSGGGSNWATQKCLGLNSTSVSAGGLHINTFAPGFSPPTYCSRRW